MDVALDVRAVQSRTFGERGVARYTRGLVTALLDAGAPLSLLALDPTLDRPSELPEGWEASGLVAPASIETYRRLPRPFALHLTSPFEMGRPVGGALSGPGIELADRLVCTLYDLIPATMPEIYLADHGLRRAYEARMGLMRRADLLLAISEHSRREAIDLLGVDADRVVVVGAAIDPPPEHDHHRDRALLAAELPGLRRPPVLSITGYEPRKNTLALIDAYASLDPSLRAEVQLLLVCSIDAEGREAWATRARERGLGADEVLVSGRLSDEVLAAAHRAARLEVFPSLAEGFGLPVLEAARAGVPVVTSDTTATPEVLDLPASTFDPRDVDDMAAVITRGLVDDELRRQIVDAGARASELHTWENVARRTLAAYRTLEPRRHATPAPRPRIGLVGPFLPAVSGVATYNERVARRLGRRCDLTVFAEHAPWSAGDRCYRLHPLDVLGDQVDRASFDRMVHTLGNSLVHRRTLLDALAHPDVVWLHEVDLRELHLLAAHWLGEIHGRAEAAEWLARRIAANDTAAPRGTDLLEVEPDALPDMVREIARSASLVVVNTPVAQEHLERKHGVLSVVIPHAVPSAADLAVPARRGPSGEPLVASFGIVADSKRPELIVEACALLRARRPVRLAFVGPCDDDLRDRLHEQARRAGTGLDITFTNHVAQREYGEWLSRSAVAVQLRREQNGAQSGAVADALGASVPVVTDMEVERAVAAAFVAPGADADELAGAIERALDVGPTIPQGLTFDDVADRLLASLVAPAT